MEDEYHIDKAHVRASFGRAAKTYDAAAILQKLVRDEMFDRLDLIKVSPNMAFNYKSGLKRRRSSP